MNRIGDNAKAIHEALSQLHQEWSTLSGQWKDQNCAEFQKNYLDPITAPVGPAAEAIARMGELIAQAEHAIANLEGD